MRHFPLKLLGMGWAYLLPIIALAQSSNFKTHTHATLLCDQQTITLNQTFEVGILLKMDKGWHTYYKDPGDSGLATRVQWTLPKGFVAGPIQWPKPKVIRVGGLISQGYEDEVLLITSIQAPATGYHSGQALRIEAEVEWLECRESCVPGSARLALPIKIMGRSTRASAESLALFKKYRALLEPENDSSSTVNPHSKTQGVPSKTKFPPSETSKSFFSFLGMAFLGGLILNLMPCVLPVLAIKILGFIKQSGHHSKETLSLGFLYGAGVLVSFWTLAALVIGLQSAGQLIGWGFQFQNPWFVMTMTLVVLIIALNFFGVFEFELPGFALGTAEKLISKSGRLGAFLNGVLATALATPCTAPFLAPALGFAFTQPGSGIIAIFTAAGIGLALPYILLAWNPSLLRWLPKPGVWMNHFRQGMGFPMLATLLWLLFALGNAPLAFHVAGWLLLTSLIIWMTSVLTRGNFLWILLAIVLVVTLAIPRLHEIISSPKPSKTSFVKEGIHWETWSSAALKQALATDRPIYLDFTADWCLTCQVNKKTSLDSTEIVRRFQQLRVLPLRGDWTHHDPEIAEAIRSYGRSGVPLNVLYPVDRSKPPILLPEILTPQTVLNALEQASAK